MTLMDCIIKQCIPYYKLNSYSILFILDVLYTLNFRTMMELADKAGFKDIRKEIALLNKFLASKKDKKLNTFYLRINIM